jgi:hypothetical protein
MIEVSQGKIDNIDIAVTLLTGNHTAMKRRIYGIEGIL